VIYIYGSPSIAFLFCNSISSEICKRQYLLLLISGKTNENQFAEGDFILAAMFLYSDIILSIPLYLIGLIDSLKINIIQL